MIVTIGKQLPSVMPSAPASTRSIGPLLFSAFLAGRGFAYLLWTPTSPLEEMWDAENNPALQNILCPHGFKRNIGVLHALRAAFLFGASLDTLRPADSDGYYPLSDIGLDAAVRGQEQLTLAFLLMNTKHRREAYEGQEITKFLNESYWVQHSSGAFYVARAIRALQYRGVSVCMAGSELDKKGVDLLCYPEEISPFGLSMQVTGSMEYDSWFSIGLWRPNDIPFPEDQKDKAKRLIQKTENLNREEKANIIPVFLSVKGDRSLVYDQRFDPLQQTVNELLDYLSLKFAEDPDLFF